VRSTKIGGIGPSLTEGELALVADTPLFARLTREALRALIAEAHVIDYAARALLFSRGDPADRFFVVLAGRVRLFVLTAEGRESVIELIEPGMSFAEAAMFATGRLPVNAEVAENSRLLHIPAAPILRRIEENPEIARKMLDSLARWQRQLIARVVDLKVHTPAQRLAAALLELTTAAAGPADVNLAVSKNGLAGLIGITPESLSRALQRLARLGVSVQGRAVAIADVGALRQYCTADATGHEGEDSV
jgi:CRP-like cAMP-binding protein